MGENKKPPREWETAVAKVLQGTDLLGRVQVSESWDFTGDAVGDIVTVLENHKHYHITVMVPGQQPLVGHADTLEGAATAVRSRVEAYLKEQKGG